MSAGQGEAPKSFGEELLRIIRSEIADYDARKAREAEVERLQRVAKVAAIDAESAARMADLPDISRAIMGDTRAKDLDALVERFGAGSDAKDHPGPVTTYNINATAARAVAPEVGNRGDR